MKIKKIIITIISCVAILLGFISIAPTSASVTATEDEFNAVNALFDLQVISHDQHSVTDYQAHEEVRQYLLKTATSIAGSEKVSERNYLTKSNTNPTEGISYVSETLAEENGVDATFDIRNILVSFEVENRPGVLLCAHYDSRGNITRVGETANSYGAGDDGYGVVTLLEIMRHVAKNQASLKNSVYFLFTDAEEPTIGDVKMGGSLLETKNTELMDKVNFVINVEARGLDGASYMFETNKKNEKVIEMYKNASDKVSYSVAPAVYSVMTNYTDFTNFLAIGKQGLNFSTLDSIETYHCAADNYENVNVSSIQHYGAQILPIVKEYYSNEKYGQQDYFVGSHDMIFYNLLPGVFVIYSSIFGLVLSFLLLAALIAFIVLSIVRKKDFKVKLLAKQTGYLLIGLVGSILIGYLFSLIVARLVGMPWNLTNVRCDNFKIIFALFTLAMMLLINYVFKLVNKDVEKYHYFLLGSVIVNTILNIALSLTLTGASFIFMIPSFIGLVNLYIDMFVSKKLVKDILFYVSLFVSLLIFVPLIYSLLLALTIGGTLALVLLAYLPYSAILPLAYKSLNN